MDKAESSHMVIAPLARSGKPTLAITGASGTERYLLSRYDPEREARIRVEASSYRTAAVIIILSIGLGYELDYLLPRLSGAQQVIVVEASREIWQLFISLTHHDERFPHARVRCCIQESPAEIRALLAAVGGGDCCVIKNEALTALDTAYYAAVEELLPQPHSRRLSIALLVGKGIVAPYYFTGHCLCVQQRRAPCSLCAAVA